MGNKRKKKTFAQPKMRIVLRQVHALNSELMFSFKEISCTQYDDNLVNHKNIDFRVVIGGYLNWIMLMAFLTTFRRLYFIICCRQRGG